MVARAHKKRRDVWCYLTLQIVLLYLLSPSYYWISLPISTENKIQMTHTNLAVRSWAIYCLRNLVKWSSHKDRKQSEFLDLEDYGLCTPITVSEFPYHVPKTWEFDVGNQSQSRKVIMQGKETISVN